LILHQKNCDVYITGSNAYLLSGELTTLLSGREEYIPYKVHPPNKGRWIHIFDDSNVNRCEYIYNALTFASAHAILGKIEYKGYDEKQYVLLMSQREDGWCKSLQQQFGSPLGAVNRTDFSK
jgi:hypothetical protein